MQTHTSALTYCKLPLFMFKNKFSVLLHLESVQLSTFNKLHANYPDEKNHKTKEELFYNKGFLVFLATFKQSQCVSVCLRHVALIPEDLWSTWVSCRPTWTISSWSPLCAVGQTHQRNLCQQLNVNNSVRCWFRLCILSYIFNHIEILSLNGTCAYLWPGLLHVTLLIVVPS